MASHHPSENEQITPGVNMQTGSSLFNGESEEKATVIENFEDYILQDSFNEDEVEHRILKSKPSCFLIIGKPGVGKTIIAKKVAEDFKAELISAADLIQENIKLQSELGKKAQDILIKGGAVPEQMVAKMIDLKVKSPEVEHHGYVLDGFPCQSEGDFDITRQVEMLKNWKYQPDFIINLRISDKDLVSRRTNQKIDPVSGNIFIKEVYAPEIKAKSKKVKIKEEEEEEGEEEVEEEEEEIPEEPTDEFYTPLPNEMVQTLIVRPEDTLPMVNESIISYKDALLHILEDQMANMDQSYLLEMDSNLSPTVIIRQLLLRLESYIIRKAFHPLRMQDPNPDGGEEGEAAADSSYIDTAEIEEAMNGLESKRRLNAKFKWRRSKFSFYCPVSLKNGKTCSGKSEFAAAFMDKIYLMNSEESLQEFLKNPRPYLMPPQPQAPCKLSILGPSHSGKTTLASVLAKKYSAKVIQMDELIKPELNKSKEVMIEKAKANAVEAAKEIIKTRFRERLEQEKAKKEMELAAKLMEAEAAEAAKPEAGEEGAETKLDEVAELPESPEKLPTPKPAVVEPEDDIASNSDKSVYMGEDGEIVVDNEHQEVLEAVAKAAEDAAKQNITLPPSVYISVLQTELDKMRKERIKADPTALSNAGWILDNFPKAADQLNALLENNLMPDSFFFLSDTSEESGIVTRRWYNCNRDQIEQKMNKRLNEKPPSDDNFVPTETPDGAKLDESKIETEEELALKRDTLEKIVEEDENLASNKTAAVTNSVAAATRSENSIVFRQPLAELKPSDPIPKSPETQEFIGELKLENEQIKSLQNSIGSVTGGEPNVIEINYTPSDVAAANADTLVKPVEEMCDEAYKVIEKNYKFVATDFEGGAEEEVGEEAEEEEDEEEEEFEDAEEMEEEDEDETFDPSTKDKKTKFGETNHYCAVSLKTNGVLVPGNSELQAKYREKLYRFSSEESKAQFIEDPELYLPKKNERLKAPATRMIIIGPRGSGKSTQARILANKLDLFHVKFRDYLQELVVGKTKKFLEPEKEEDRDEEEEEDDEDEDRDSETPEKEEPVIPELTEKEDMIRGYLERDEALPVDIIDSVLSQLWTAEPFKSKGFVLDGFPNNETEAAYLIEKGYFPDAIIILKVEEDQIVKRLLPPRLAKWQARMAAKKEKKRLKTLRKKEKLNKRIKERREEEIAKYEEEKRKKEIELETSGEAEEDGDEEPFDVEAIIQEEFADELAEEEIIDDVNEDEVKENMISDIKNNFENQTNLIDSAKETLQEALIPRFKVDGNRREKIVEHLISKKIQRFVNNRESLLERVYAIKFKTAHKLIDFGYKQLSRFGRWCPVKLMNKQPVSPFYGETSKPQTVLHRSFVYFLSSKEAKKKFCENPIYYLKQASPMSVVPFRLSIIGPPKSGKSTLANRFVKEFGCVRLSVGEAIRAILNNQSNTALAQEIRTFLFKGKTMPDELAIQCLEISILDVKCQLRGYVLDGFPNTKQQVKLMTDRGLIPVKIIELKCDIKEIMQRCIKDRTSTERLTKNLILNDSPEIIGYKLREWKKEISFIREWYSNEHKNLIQLDGTESKWSLWEKSKQISFESVELIQVYLKRVSQQKAASIAKLCVTYDEMKSRLGDFGQYCPVCLALQGELVDCSECRSMDFVSEFQGYYYKMHSAKELDLFLDTPKDFVAPKAPRKLPPPHLLPKKLTAADVKKLFPKQVELNGYCPVTFYDGKERYEAIVQGSIDYAVDYMNKIFYMTNLETREKFMRKPEIYGNLILPHKLPPVTKKIDVFSLPMTGFLEQTVSELVKKSLNQVGNYKPKFPFLSPTRSSLLYLAYYLKAYNPKSSEYRRKKYKQKLVFFEEKCELINFLYSQTTLRYKEPTKRTLEYNSKFESFFALQDNAPTMNWLS